MFTQQTISQSAKNSNWKI